MVPSCAAECLQDVGHGLLEAREDTHRAICTVWWWILQIGNDDDWHAGGESCLGARRRIFEDQAAIGIESQSGGGDLEELGRGFSAPRVFCSHDMLEIRFEACLSQRRGRVVDGARRSQSEWGAGSAKSFQKRYRATLWMKFAGFDKTLPGSLPTNAKAGEGERSTESSHNGGFAVCFGLA